MPHITFPFLGQQEKIWPLSHHGCISKKQDVHAVTELPLLGWKVLDGQGEQESNDEPGGHRYSPLLHIELHEMQLLFDVRPIEVE